MRGDMGNQKTNNFSTRPIDRRKYVRVNIYSVTRYFCPTCDQNVGIQTLISDLSEGGAFLVTFDKEIPIATKVRMNFILPHTETSISVEGVIRHTGSLDNERYRSGLEFKKVKKKDREAIYQYVAINLREKK